MHAELLDTMTGDSNNIEAELSAGRDNGRCYLALSYEETAIQVHLTEQDLETLALKALRAAGNDQAADHLASLFRAQGHGASALRS
ncbi:MAG: hypothetical protein QM767_04880 [Anaeromyxobacter sp.]